MTVTTYGSHGEPVIQDPPTTIADMTAIAAYAKTVGTRMVITSSQKGSFSATFGFAPYAGLEVFETDTSNTFFYSGTGWVGIRSQAGVVAFASGDFSASGGGFQATRTVNLIGGRFTAPPSIGIGVFTQAANDQHAGVANVTQSSFTLYFWRANQSATSVGWTAIPADS